MEPLKQHADYKIYRAEKHMPLHIHSFWQQRYRCPCPNHSSTNSEPQ